MSYPLWLQLSLLKPPYDTAVIAMIVRCTGASESDSSQKVQEWVGEVVGVHWVSSSLCRPSYQLLMDEQVSKVAL